MKILSYIILLFTLTFVSCSDFLEQYPKDGLVLDEYWQNKEDLFKVLNGAYGKLAEMDVDLLLSGEIRGDMIAQGSNILNFNTPVGAKWVMEADILATNKFCEWGDYYEVINYCNYIIKYAPLIKERDITFSEYYKEAYIAEATALRSLMYFYLVRTFKDVPYVTWATESDAVDLFPAKTDGDIILATILEDLVNAEMVEKIPDFYGDEASTKGRMNRYAAYAMIADIALWQFDYDLALEYIDKIENSAQFFLVSNKDWYNLFAQGNMYESIFEIQMSYSNGNPNRLYAATINNPLQYFIASRYAESLFYGSTTEGESTEKTRKEGTLLTYNIYKYTGILPSSKSTVPYYRTDQNDANFIIYRYADIMLMKAEALTQKPAPEYELALELINSIRIRANVPMLRLEDFSLSQLVAEQYILKERALELAYEGKRWYDLLRYGRRNDYAQKDDFISLLLENVSPTQRLIMASKMKDANSWYMPIYQNEINNNINLVQNPFYLSAN